MRHRNDSVKLGRTAEHRAALMAALVCGLINEKRIRTTLPKARLARRLAERMITLARRKSLAARRQAIAVLRQPRVVTELFDTLAPQFEGRAGGYTRVLKLGQRRSDGAEMAMVEWVGVAVPDKTKKPRKVEASES